MQIEVSENWLTAGGIIGALLFGAIGAFTKLYTKSREDERSSAAASPAVAATAVGAAFVDRATAQDVALIREDVSAIRRIAEDRQGQEEEDRVRRLAEDVARDVAREEVRRGGPKQPAR